MLEIKPRIAHSVISVFTGDTYLRTNTYVGLRGLEKLIVSELVKKFSKYSGTCVKIFPLVPVQSIACNLRATLCTSEELCSWNTNSNLSGIHGHINGFP
jgi:hypothetical protein